MNTRREFLKNGMYAAAGGMLAGCVGGAKCRAPVLAGDFIWGAMLHLGSNMWSDWVPGVKYPKSAAEEAALVKAGKIEFKSSRLYCQRDYFSTDWNSWRKQVDAIKAEGLKMVFIDIGEAYAFPSHPELWVAGSLSESQLREELQRIRALGLEPIPKLNFSACHDQWLREYHYMTSSAAYYKVVADVIRDVCEAFDCPRYFHLGFDEEIYAGVASRQLCVIRQQDIWWKDFLFAVNAVERQGMRAIVWSDKICGGREEFLKRMPKSVMMMAWYYGNDFSEKLLKWDPKFEKSQKWDIQRNLAASIAVLANAGYDLMPCTSNWSHDDAADAMLAYCSKNIDAKRIKGYITAPWRKAVPEDDAKALSGIHLFAEAKRKYYK